jgi:type II secretory pathway component PulK
MMPRPTFPVRAPRRQRGAVIVLVLVTLLLASFLLAAFIRRTGTELLADARAAERRQLRAEGYSALESMLAVLAAQRAAEGALFSPDEYWAEALTDAGYAPAGGREVTIVFEDESGKISLPKADAVTLQTAMEASGVAAADAERMANSLLAWMREGGREEASDLDAPDYKANEPSYRPARRTLHSWGELAAVEMDRHIFFDESGTPTAVLRTFMQEFSLHSFQRTNLNTATANVLVTLGLGQAEADALMDHRARPRRPEEIGYFRSLTEAATVIGPAAAPDRFSSEIETLRINLTVRQGAVAFRLTVVVAAAAKGGATARSTPPAAPNANAAQPEERKRLDYPFAVMEIREDIEAPEPPAPTT